MSLIILVPFAPIVAYIAACLWLTRGEPTRRAAPAKCRTYSR